MGFDISGFTNAFLNKLNGAANSITSNGIINNDEINAAQNVVSTFKDQLKNISDPIGDTVSFSTKNEVSVDDLLAFLDPSISAKVKEYAVTKPVETIKPGKTPTVSSKMAEMAEDVDIDKLNAFLDMAYNSKLADDIAKSVNEIDENIGDYKIADALEEGVS